MTLWHGIKIQIGLAPMALATARTLCGFPMVFAISWYVFKVP
jgi:hypothetical protein